MAPVPRPQTVHVAARPLGAEAPEQLTSPELYFNRELSLLAFHHRVFEQARDESVPLLERLRFLCIASTNLDEFFEVRVAGLRKQLKYGISAATPDAMTVGEVLKQVHATTPGRSRSRRQRSSPTSWWSMTSRLAAGPELLTTTRARR